MKEILTKSDARAIFTTYTALAKALDLSPQAVSQWPEQLTERQINEVTGAAIRAGLLKNGRRRQRRSAVAAGGDGGPTATVPVNGANKTIMKPVANGE